MGDDLNQRIADAKARLEAQSRPRGQGRQLGLGFRMATDFTAAVIVGAGLGWGIDALTGWSPWALVTCLLLGFVTGVRNVVRAAMETSRAAADGTAEAEGRGRSAPGEDQGG